MCAMLGDMSELTEPVRVLESEVITPDPPEAFTAYELISMKRLASASYRRSARRAQDNIESGAAAHFAGADADAIKAANFGSITRKVEAWLDATWASVWDVMLAEGADAADEAGARERWIEATKLEGSRLGILHPSPMSAEGEGETVGEARWQAVGKLKMKVDGPLPRDLEIVVISEGTRGMLGVGQEPARVLARMPAA